MLKDRFSIAIVIRVILILAISLAIAFLFARTEFLFSQLIFILVLGILVYDLIRYVRRTSRELNRFLTSVKFEDPTISFPDKKLGKEFSNLSETYREIIHAFRKVKIEKESQYHLLQAVIDKISLGIITIDSKGEILLMNESASVQLGISRLTRWDFIKQKVPEFAQAIKELGNEGKTIIELTTNNEDAQLLVNIRRIILMEKECRIITIQDIRSEIEQKEIEAWYKMIRILTHEIMNSVTPLGSLTDTILMLLEENGSLKPKEKLRNEQIKDIRDSVVTIQSRSKGILQFVEDYRKLTSIPHPEFENVPVFELFDSVIKLMKPETDKKNITFITEIIPEDLSIKADRKLFEQILINFITNSMYALEKCPDPWIQLSGFKNKGNKMIRVADNGRGIERSKLDKIFIPFFSTREGGSGIGLSFSKHVVYLHNGRIRVMSEPEEGTVFTISLPA